MRVMKLCILHLSHFRNGKMKRIVNFILVKRKFKKSWLTININKTNNHLSSQFIEHKDKKTTTYNMGHPGPSFGVAGLNQLIIYFKN